MTAPLPATFREDPAEKRVYIGMSDVAETLARIESEGGSVDQPRFEVPGIAVLRLFRWKVSWANVMHRYCVRPAAETPHSMIATLH